MERGRHRIDLSIATGGQMARRQTVHGQGCQTHLGPIDRQGEREAADRSTQVCDARSPVFARLREASDGFLDGTPPAVDPASYGQGASDFVAHGSLLTP